MVGSCTVLRSSEYYQKPLLVVQGNIAELVESSEDMEDIDVGCMQSGCQLLTMRS